MQKEDNVTLVNYRKNEICIFHCLRRTVCQKKLKKTRESRFFVMIVARLGGTRHSGTVEGKRLRLASGVFFEKLELHFSENSLNILNIHFWERKVLRRKKKVSIIMS